MSLETDAENMLRLQIVTAGKVSTVSVLLEIVVAVGKLMIFVKLFRTIKPNPARQASKIASHTMRLGIELSVRTYFSPPTELSLA